MDGAGGAADSETGHEDDRTEGGSSGGPGSGGKLLAVSDLHISYAENRSVVQALRPHSENDWLLVAGDISERLADIAIVLRLLTQRFAQVIWVPGNHDLWSSSTGDDQMRGVARYDLLVALCRELGVLTPEDPYPLWHGSGGPVRIAPLFLLYDYTFRPPGTSTKEEGLAYAYRTGVVCNDEFRLHPDPYPSREAWCQDRVALTQQRLDECDPSVPLVLVNHYPLVREPTRILRYPEFAQWCGTSATADWHTRYRVAAAVYGHLHIPRTTWHDGVRFEEVSLGYPREWGARPTAPVLPREILPGVKDGIANGRGGDGSETGKAAMAAGS